MFFTEKKDYTVRVDIKGNESFFAAIGWREKGQFNTLACNSLATAKKLLEKVSEYEKMGIFFFEWATPLLQTFKITENKTDSAKIVIEKFILQKQIIILNTK